MNVYDTTILVNNASATKHFEFEIELSIMWLVNADGSVKIDTILVDDGKSGLRENEKIEALLDEGYIAYLKDVVFPALPEYKIPTPAVKNTLRLVA